MAVEQSQVPVLEMAHVLFMDIVSYSKLPMDEQQRVLRHLQHAVRDTSDFQRAQNSDQLIRLPTGDGMALVFFGDPEAPARCALELSRALRSLPDLKLRMGIHTGPVYRLADINANRNVSGGGINLAQRVMDCGDANHILVSAAVAEVLSQISSWEHVLHDLGEAEVKHGVRVHVFNLYTDEAGNPDPPPRLHSTSTPVPAAIKEDSSAPLDSFLGQTVSHYRVLRRLGGGGMGVIYEALDTRLGRHVALKFLSEHLLHDPHALERFRREATLASSLNHPNICTLHDIGEHDGRSFLVLELLDGDTLRERIEAGPIELLHLLEWGIQIADALQMAHSRSIVHRDIKPGNIIITARGEAKILDFGLAKLGAAYQAADSAQGRLTLAGVPLGTVAYMSPEQARGEELDGRSDIFSLGAVLYEMATGRLPFDGNTSAVVFDAILNRAPIAPVTLKPGLPTELQRIINLALEKDREKRYRTAGEIATDLKCLLRALESSPRAHAHAVPPVLPPRRSLRPLLYVAVALVAIGSIGIVAWRARSHSAQPANVPVADARSDVTKPTPSATALAGREDAAKVAGAKPSPEVRSSRPQPNVPPGQVAASLTEKEAGPSATASRPSKVSPAFGSRITGHYSGSLQVALPDAGARATAVFHEQGGVISGCLRLSPPLRGSGPFRAVTQGPLVLATVFFSGGRTELQGQFTGDELRGKYLIVDSGKLRQGTFVFQRQVSPAQAVSFDVSKCPAD